MNSEGLNSNDKKKLFLVNPDSLVDQFVYICVQSSVRY